MSKEETYIQRRYRTDVVYRERQRELARLRKRRVRELNGEVRSEKIDLGSVALMEDTDARKFRRELVNFGMRISNLLESGLLGDYYGVMDNFMLSVNDTISKLPGNEPELDLSNDEILVRLRSSGLRDKTILDYHQNYRKIQELYYKLKETELIDSVNFLLDYDLLIGMIDENKDWLDSTKGYYYTGLVKVCVLCNFDVDITSHYRFRMNHYTEQNDTIRRCNKRNELDFDWIDLLNAYDSKYESLDEEQRLIGALYIERPPLRSEWARNVYIVSEINSNRRNYIYWGDGIIRLHLSDYKNSKSFGVYEYNFEPSTRVYDVVLRHLERRGINNLFFDFTERVLQSKISNLTLLLLNKKNIGVQKIRRSYETWLQNSKNYQESSIAERVKYHKDVLHSFTIAQEYRFLSSS